MMKIKKRHLLLLLLVGVFLVGGVSAFMFKKTQTIQNDFAPATLSCSVTEEFDGTNKTSIIVKNDQKSNVDAYLRVRLISYWQNAEGKIVGKPSEMPEVPYNSENWVKSESEDVYYHKTQVAPGNGVQLLSEDEQIILGESTFAGETVYQVVEIFAEAIQSDPTIAASEAWGVTIADETITAAP